MLRIRRALRRSWGFLTAGSRHLFSGQGVKLIVWCTTIGIGTECICISWKNITSNASWTCGHSWGLRHWPPAGKRSNNSSSLICHMFWTTLWQALRLTLNDYHKVVQHNLSVCACPERQRSFLGVGEVRATDGWSSWATVSLLKECDGGLSWKNQLNKQQQWCKRWLRAEDVFAQMAHQTCSYICLEWVSAKRKILAVTKFGVLLFAMPQLLNKLVDGCFVFMVQEDDLGTTGSTPRTKYMIRDFGGRNVTMSLSCGFLLCS